jgi:hypothetical protein
MKMPALILVAAAASLSAAPASPKDGASPPTKEQIKASEQKIAELQKKRIAILKDQVDDVTQVVALPRASGDYFGEAVEGTLLLLQAELGAAEKEADRISLYKKAAGSLKKYEELANDQVKAGNTAGATVLKIKARRLELEIRLEQAKAKEAKPGTAAPQIKELQRERIDALAERVDGLTKLAEKMSGEFEELIEARRLLLQAELEVARTEPERVSLYKKAIDALKDYEVWANARVQAKQAIEADVLLIQVRRLEVEIELERAKVEEAKKAAVAAILSAAPAEQPEASKAEELQKKRVAVLEKLVDQLAVSAQKIKELQKERTALLKKRADQLTELFPKRGVRYEHVLEAQRMLIEARLEGTETDAERVELYENLVTVLARCEENAKAYFAAGRVPRMSIFKEKAKRLEAESHLEQAKMKAAKQGTTQPRPPEMMPPRPADMVSPRVPE